jgi:hypothetical protein
MHVRLGAVLLADAHAAHAAQDIDGVLMVMDPSVTEQERELEALYMNFAQPAGLTIKQCLTLGLQVVKDGSFGLGGWGGERARS